MGLVLLVVVALLASGASQIALATDTLPPATTQPLIVLTGSSCQGNLLDPLVENPLDRALREVTINGQSYLTYREQGVVQTVSLPSILAAFPRLLEFLRRPLLESVERMTQDSIENPERSTYLRLWPRLGHLENDIRDGRISLTFSNATFRQPLRLIFAEGTRRQITGIEISHHGMNLFLEVLDRHLRGPADLVNLATIIGSSPLSNPAQARLDSASLELGAAIAGLLSQIEFIYEHNEEPSIFDLKLAENQGASFFKLGPGAVAENPSLELWATLKVKSETGKNTSDSDVSSIAWAFAPELQQQLSKTGGGDTIQAALRRRDRLEEFNIMGEQNNRSFAISLAKTEALQGRHSLLFKELGRAAAFYEFARLYFNGDREDSRFLDATVAARALQHTQINFEYAYETLYGVMTGTPPSLVAPGRNHP